LDGIDQRLDRIDQRLDGIDQRLDGIDQRFEGLERRLDGFAIDVGRRFDERSLSIRVLGRRQDKMAGRIDALEALVEESQATRP
jgi:archaellum component FlaC